MPPTHQQAIDGRSDRSFAILVSCAFLVLTAVTISHHAMWRDEFQAWLIARDSISLTDVFRRTRYEGHPAIWYLILFVLTRLSQSPTIMQAAHLLIACLTVYIFVGYSTFSRLQKLFFAFGYFPAFEYAIVSRNYSIGILLLFIACIFWRSRYTHPLRLGIVLALAANTSMHALIIALSMELVVISEFLRHRNAILSIATVKPVRLYCGFATMLIGTLLAVCQMIPPSDSQFTGWYWGFNAVSLKAIVNLFVHAFFPIPNPELHFWGKNIFEEYWRFVRIEIYFSCAFIALLVVTFAQRPLAWATYAIGTAGLLAFFYMKNSGQIRHHGFLFILFMVAAWLYRSSEEDDIVPTSARCTSHWGITSMALVTLILMFQLIGGLIARVF